MIEKGESSELLERLTKEQRQQFGSIIKALLDLKDSPKYQTLLTMLGEKRPMPVIIDFINNEKGGDSGAQVDSSLS
ncbi:hypothetical protein SDC9_129588 [bioreactor metagenome]|uniref:Uncharacterized protein n=1 Tax=bioreactor metagenome TaxID=1076179 RepID=A0A645D018_9ZZZZ